MARKTKGSKKGIATSNSPGFVELLVQRRIPSISQWSDDERHRMHDAHCETNIRYALMQVYCRPCPMPVSSVMMLAFPYKATTSGLHAAAINPVRMASGGEP